jgi:hypothetical protein
MKKTIGMLALGGVLLGISVQGTSAAAMKETIYLKAPAGMSALHMTTGVAKVTYSAHDVSVNVTAAHLPAPSTVHGNKFYVVWLKSGSKNWFVGDLKMMGAMKGTSGMLMIKTFQDINITAEKTAHPMHAMGTLVLSGMSTHH